jgi:hypothetical protein
VPAEFVDAGKHAFAWRNIDAELAELTYDSLTSVEDALSMRAETAWIRALTFSSPRLTIELEVVADSLLGQIVPGQLAVITVEPKSGTSAIVDVDDIGRFLMQPMPAGLFRLRCRTVTGIQTLTGWITLDRA